MRRKWDRQDHTYKSPSPVSTTGATSVAAKEGLMVEELHSPINAPKDFKRGAKIHSITNEMLTREPSPKHVFPKFQTFMNVSVLVAHNARFDMSILKAEFHYLGLGLADRYQCTNKLSGKHCPRLTCYSLVLACWCKFSTLPDMNRTRSAERTSD
jgi:DNA polymerase III alpha subunit (gram-positive type)